jgi:hypothetical protein
MATGSRRAHGQRAELATVGTLRFAHPTDFADFNCIQPERTTMAIKDKAKTEGKAVESADAKLKNAKATADITYYPGDGDPHRITWAGLEFKAYVPTPVALTHAILVPLRKEHVLADGTVQSRNIETRVSLVELARGNPSFAVDGVRIERKVGTARVPSSNDEYRGYAIAWIAASTGTLAMDTRWEAEAALRAQCGVDDKDLAYLRPFFEARRDQVKAAETGLAA